MGKYSMARVAAVNICFQYFSLDYFLESIAKIGFEKVDLWTGYPHMLLDGDYAAQCRRIRRRCESLGLAVDNLMPKVIGWPLNIADAEEKIRRRAVEYLKRAVDAAELLGAPTLQLVPGSGLYDHPVEDAWARSRESLSQVAEYAGSQGKRAALEAVQIYETNLVGNKDSLNRMVQEVGSPYLGAVVDTTHMAANGETLEEYFALLGNRIWRVHLNENHQLPWGEGGAPVDQYLKTLEQWGYDGNFSLEICSKPHYLNPAQAMEVSYWFLKEALLR